MLPLGGLWTGDCLAASATDAPPDDATVHRLCNIGYARGACPRFPAADGPDAVRFTISRHDPDTIGVYFVVERDHHPFAHGALEFSPAADAFTAPPYDIRIVDQARAYLASYLRRKSEAAA